MVRVRVRRQAPPPKTTYADRLIYQLYVRRSTSFYSEDLVEEVLVEMETRGEQITRMSRACLEHHLFHLRRSRLVRRGRANRNKLRVTGALRKEIKRLKSRMPHLGPTELKHISTLVRIGAYPKRVTAKELRQEYIKLRDDYDDLEEQNHNLKEENDALRKENAVLKARVPEGLNSDQPYSGTGDESPMDVDVEVPPTPQVGPMNFGSPEHEPPHSDAAALRRTPTLDYIDPITPARNSGGGSQFLPTPPNSDERPLKRISRNDSRRSAQSFRQHVQERIPSPPSAQWQVPRASSPSPSQRRRTPPCRDPSQGRVSTAGGVGDDESLSAAALVATARRQVDSLLTKLEADVSRQTGKTDAGTSARERELLQRLAAAEETINGLQRQVAQLEGENSAQKEALQAVQTKIQQMRGRFAAFASEFEADFA
ncbi:hypothetical protein C8Q80DRAFT_148977 [Daedaleopsis nitida]|nr:hypothetical protein C8Q80DRAFT_148977 [Daedaleopsis nitida]